MTKRKRPTSPEEQWWTINGAELLAALERVSAGDHPSIVYAELYANSETEDP